jgi:hypothetical protein
MVPFNQSFKRELTKSAILVVLLALCSVGQAQNNPEKPVANSGVVFGRDHVFVLTAPKGWILDSRSGVSQGFNAVFYPEGSSWQNGNIVMYANVYHKRNVSEETLETVISGDVAEFKKKSDKLKVAEAAPLPTRKDKQAAVRYFDGDTFGNSEAIAYLDEGKVVVMLVLSARTKKQFEAALPAFNVLVSSYLFLGDKVTIQK